MGISDEDYAKAIQEQRKKDLVLKLMELQAQQQQENAKAQLATNGTVSWGAGAATTTGALHYPNNVPNRELRMRAEDLDHEAAKVSLSVLTDMWVIRWQDRWVNKNEIVEDDFWRIAFARLENVNKLERHILADTMQYVYRIIE